MTKETTVAACCATNQEVTLKQVILNDRLSSFKRAARAVLFAALAVFAGTASSHEEQQELNAWLDEEFVAAILNCEKVTAVKIMAYGPWSTTYLAKCLSKDQTTFYTFIINRNTNDPKPMGIRKFGE